MISGKSGRSERRGSKDQFTHLVSVKRDLSKSSLPLNGKAFQPFHQLAMDLTHASLQLLEDYLYNVDQSL